MATKDTIELLKECDAGIKMSVSSIDQVIDKITNEEFRSVLTENKQAHEDIGNKMHQLLIDNNCDSGDPNPMVQGMSWLKTNMMISMDNRDETIADLMTDGCDMGIKSLRKYLNQYESASAEVKDLCREIIDLEEDLRNKLKEYL